MVRSMKVAVPNLDGARCVLNLLPEVPGKVPHAREIPGALW